MSTTRAVDQVWRRVRALGLHREPERFRRSYRDPRYMSIMVVDVIGFGRLDNLAQMRVRHALNAAVRHAFRRAGIRWSLSIEDRGDGMLVLVPFSKSTVELLDPVLPTLAARIGVHNETASSRIRLRVSVHTGLVHRDATGWVGSDLTTACRLVDSPPVRRHLSLHPAADLVVAASDAVYQSVVVHRYRSLDPATYQPVHVAVKELKTRAWLHIVPPGAATESAVASSSSPAR